MIKYIIKINFPKLNYMYFLNSKLISGHYIQWQKPTANQIFIKLQNVKNKEKDPKACRRSREKLYTKEVSKKRTLFFLIITQDLGIGIMTSKSEDSLLYPRIQYTGNDEKYNTDKVIHF